MSFAPLAGIRVVDVTSSLAGPTCTEILGGLGADVVKVEHPARGDEARAWGPSFFDGGSVMFFAANRSKRSLALDFKNEQGQQALLRLVDGADVFVQSLRSGTAERLGRSGPLADEPGYDPLMQAFAGLISITGEPERPGVRVGASVIDLGTGVWAALGILAALLERTSTGRGRDVSVALYDTALSLVGYQLAAVLRTGVVPGRHGTAFPLIVPYEVFPTSDGVLMIAAANDGLFRLLCERIDRAELADDPRFLTNPDRVANREQLLPSIRDRLAAESSAHWLERLAGIPAAPVQDLAATVAHPQTRANDMLQDVDGVEAVASPLKVDGERFEHRLPPPLLGEHSTQVLRELGYGDDDIEALVRAGTVGSPT
jgi:crotonobetainyl-CoA:carnitine CoA-transferase CaiB-like acyl-CoA transferase